MTDIGCAPCGLPLTAGLTVRMDNPDQLSGSSEVLPQPGGEKAQQGWGSAAGFSEHQQLLQEEAWAPCGRPTDCPQRGHKKKSRGIMRVSPPPPAHGPPFCLSSFISSHPYTQTHSVTFLLHPWCSIFCWEAFFGSRKGSGIVFSHQWKFRWEPTSRGGLVYRVVLQGPAVHAAFRAERLETPVMDQT